MSLIGSPQKLVTVNQIAESIFNIASEKDNTKQMTSYEKSLIMNSLILGVQLERSKPQPQELINFVLEIGQNLEIFEELCNKLQMDIQEMKEKLYHTFFFNPNLNLFTLLKKEIKVQSKKLLGNSKAQILIQKKQNKIKIKDEEQRLNNERSIKECIEKDRLIEEQIQKDASFALAYSIQQEFDQEARLIYGVIQEQTPIETILQKPTQCSICQEELQIEDRMCLNQCQHLYHRECLAPYFQMKIKEKDFPLKCPEIECKQDVLYDDLSLILDDTTFTQYNQYTLESAIIKNPDDMSWCPTADCKYAFAFTQGISEFSCPLCKKHYCLSCKIEFHVGQTCAQYKASVVDNQSDNKFVAFAMGSKFKQCPQCKHWVEKADGCNHITCRCKYEFCYACGGPYPVCFCGKR